MQQKFLTFRQEEEGEKKGYIRKYLTSEYVIGYETPNINSHKS